MKQAKVTDVKSPTINIEKMLDYLLDIKKFSKEEIDKIKKISSLIDIVAEEDRINIDADFSNHLDDEFDSIEKGDEIYFRLVKDINEIYKLFKFGE